MAPPTPVTILNRTPTYLYWKFQVPNTVPFMKEHMDSKNFYYKVSLSKDRASELVVRCMRGLLSYDRYKPAELKNFIQERTITSLALLKGSKKTDLVGILEQADDDATFDRLWDLPAELRLRIFKFHFDALEETYAMTRGIESLSQPPVCSVSRQMRAETLPFYYNYYQFPISLYTHNSRDFVSGDHQRKIEAHVMQDTKTLFQSIEPQYLSRIKRLKIMIDGAGYAAQARWEVNLADSPEIVVEGRYLNSIMRVQDGDAAYHSLTKRLQGFFGEIAARPANQKLKFDDLRAFEVAVNEILRTFDPVR